MDTSRAYLVIALSIAAVALFVVVGLPPVLSHVMEGQSEEVAATILEETVWVAERPNGTVVIDKWLSNSYDDAHISSEVSLAVRFQSRSGLPPVLGNEGLEIYTFVNTTHHDSVGESATFRFASSQGLSVYLPLAALEDATVLDAASSGNPPNAGYVVTEETSLPTGSLVEAILVFVDPQSAPFQIDADVEIEYLVDGRSRLIEFPFTIVLERDATQANPRVLTLPSLVDAFLSDEDAVDAFRIELAKASGLEIQMNAWRSSDYYFELWREGDLLASTEGEGLQSDRVTTGPLLAGTYQILVVQAFGQGGYTLSVSPI